MSVVDDDRDALSQEMDDFVPDAVEKNQNYEQGVNNTLQSIEENSGVMNNSSYMAASLPNFNDSSILDHSPKKFSKSKRPFGNSASGKTLAAKSYIREDIPKSVFSCTINLPQLKTSQCHKKFADHCKTHKPPNMEVPPYKGYITADNLKKSTSKTSLPLINKKEESDILVSRYRRANPLREAPHMSWVLHNQLKWSEGRKGKLLIRDLDNPDIVISQKEEDEYLKSAIFKPDEDDRCYDEEGKFFIGENALKEFNIHYKLIEKIESENKAKEVPSSVYTNILSQINKKRLLPIKMNVVKRNGDPSVVDCR